MSKEEGKPEKVCARAPLAVENLASVSHTATPAMEGMESLLVRVQRAFNFTEPEMCEKIEPAIRQAIEVGPRDEATPIPKGASEYKLDRAFTQTRQELDALTETCRRWFDFERTTEQLREAQKLLRHNYPRRRGNQLEAPCKVLAAAWRATGRDFPRTRPKQYKRREQDHGHAFVKMIVGEHWPGRAGEGLDSIIRRI